MHIYMYEYIIYIEREKERTREEKSGIRKNRET